MRDHFRSRDKDGGHTIRSAISKNPAARKLHGCMCYYMKRSYCRE